MSEYTEQADQLAAKYGITLGCNGRRFGKHFDDDTQNRHIYDLRLSRNGQHYDFIFGQSMTESCINTPAIETQGAADAKNVGKRAWIPENKKYPHHNGKYVWVFLFTIHATYAQLKAIRDNDADWESVVDMERFDKTYEKCISELEKTNFSLTSKPEWARDAVLQEVERAVSEMITAAENKMVLWNEDPNGSAPDMYSVLASLTKYDPVDFENFCANYGYDEDSRKAEKTYHAVVEEWKNVERLFGDILDELQEIN